MKRLNATLPGHRLAFKVPSSRSPIRLGKSRTERCPPCPPSVSFIRSPTAFHRLLLSLSRDAEHRVSWSSLYLGKDDQSRELVDALVHGGSGAATREFRLLVDYHRTMRELNENPVIRQLLATDDQLSCGDGVNRRPPRRRRRISLYRSPLHSSGFLGLLRALRLPTFVREIISVQHTKIYVFDDHVVLSGANLSQDYFTNRQDRYILIRNHKALADFYCSFLEMMHGMSHDLVLDPDQGVLVTDPVHCPHSVDTRFQEFVAAEEQKLQSHGGGRRENDSAVQQTTLYPLFQFGGKGIRQETSALSKILRASDDDSTAITVASAYFNPTSEFVSSCSHHAVDLLVAAPRANGFFKAPGLSRLLPFVYTFYEHQFLRRFPIHRLFEYARPGFTFHGKGIWWLPTAAAAVDNKDLERGPCGMTFIGSSNLGHRSADRDLEASLLIQSNDPQFVDQLRAERRNLMRHASPVPTTQQKEYEASDRHPKHRTFIHRFLIRATSIFFKPLL